MQEPIDTELELAQHRGRFYKFMEPWIKRYRPDEMLENIFMLEPATLTERNIKGLIIDLDNTLVPWGEGCNPAPESLILWADTIKKAGIKLIILSNNHRDKVEPLANELGVPIISMAGKPSKRAFRKAIEMLGVAPEHIAVIGDQLFTDVLGGNRLELYTIMVKPLSARELWVTKIVRRLEWIVLGRD